MFESIDKLILGFLTGIIFGFLLQKGQVAKYDVIVGQFLLKDFTVAKIMGTAVATGAIGIWVMHTNGMIHLEIKSAAFSAIIIGGVLFGIGLSILGLCPGTSVAACGEGNRHAMAGVSGMVIGAFAFVTSFPALDPITKALGDMGKVTLPQITKTSPWLWVAGICVAAVVGLPLLKSKSHQPA